MSCSLHAQSRKALEQKREQLINQIEQTTSLLQKTQATKASSLDKYYVLQSTIKKRENLIANYKKEIEVVDTALVLINQEIELIQIEEKELIAQYSEMMRKAYHLRKNNILLQFLFASTSFNDAYVRWQFIRRYKEHQEKQAQLIAQTQNELKQKKINLENTRIEKESLLNQTQAQGFTLSVELNEMDGLVEQLKQDENRIKKQLSQQQKDHAQLNASIQRIIQNEIAKQAAKESKAVARSTPPNNKTTTPKYSVPTYNTKLSGDFAQNKGRFHRPVAGAVVKYFGKQNHPTIPGIKITNNGIDIRSQSSAMVKAIFRGEVVSVNKVPGYQTTIIIRHGGYYTVYSNIEKSFVKAGDNIATHQNIGQLGREKIDLHFEIWNGKQRMNPLQWVD